MSVISADNVFAMGTVLLGLTYLGFWIDNKPIGKKTSGMVWVLIAAMFFSNIGITPFTSPAYDFVGAYMVSLAIPLLLFKANIRQIFKESGKVIFIFGIASSATVAGAIIGFYLIDLGDIGPKVAGVYTGGYIGGAVNFLAVSQVVEMTETEFTSSISASSVVSMLALMMLIALPGLRWVTRFFPATYAQKDEEAASPTEPPKMSARVNLSHLSGALALSFSICAASSMFASYFGAPQYTILFITIITIVIANCFAGALGKLEGDFELGMIFMYIFFAMVGSSTNALAFIGSALNLFLYGMLIIIIHISIVLVTARVFKMDLAETIIASSAALVGPAPTAAIATSQGWHSLVIPGIMCGVFGYVIGTFIGVSVTALLN